MQTQINKGSLLKWILISCGIIFIIVVANILTIPLFISSDYVKNKITHTIEDRLKFTPQIGTISFYWPNRFGISNIVLQGLNQNPDAQTQIRDVKCTIKLIPLIYKVVDIKKIFIKEINFENRVLVRDLITRKFSYRDGVVSTDMRLVVNEGPSVIKGTVNFTHEKPAFDVSIDARDIHITQDMPALQMLPIFTVKEGEVGGILNVNGSIQGKGLDKRVFNKKLVANMNIRVRDGYISGNKLLSSILEIIGVKDTYYFDSIDADIQIKDEKIFIPKMDIRGQVISLNTAGMSEFDGKISYDAVIKFDKECIGKDIKKITDLVLKQNEVPIEIRGTTKNPKISVKLSKDNIENLVRGFVDDFIKTPKEGHRKDAGK